MGIITFDVDDNIDQEVQYAKSMEDYIISISEYIFHALFINWLGWLSSYSWFVATTAHFTFNQINPRFLRSVYMNKQGTFRGELWMINGERVAGCLAGVVYVVITYLFVNFR